VTFGTAASNILITAIELSQIGTYVGIGLFENIAVEFTPATTSPTALINLFAHLEFLIAAVYCDSPATLTAASPWAVAGTPAATGAGVFTNAITITPPPKQFASQNPCTTSVSTTGSIVIVGLQFSTPVTQATTAVKVGGRYIPQGLMVLRPYGDTPAALASDQGWLGGGVSGFALRLHWGKDLQPTSSGSFTWAYLDAAFAMAQASGLLLSINITAGVSSPAWIYTAGAAMFTMTGFANPAPPPWDPVFQTYWLALNQALVSRYSANLPLLSYIDLEGAGINGQMDWCQANADNLEMQTIAVSKGFSPNDFGVAIWINGVGMLAAIYATAMPLVPLIATKGAPVYFRDASGYFTAVNSLLTKYANAGIKDNALSPSYNSGGKQLMAQFLQQYSPTHPTGMQELAAATGQQQFRNNMRVALSLGCSFVEIYPSDEPLMGNSALSNWNQQLIQQAIENAAGATGIAIISGYELKGYYIGQRPA